MIVIIIIILPVILETVVMDEAGAIPPAEEVEVLVGKLDITSYYPSQNQEIGQERLHCNFQPHAQFTPAGDETYAYDLRYLCTRIPFSRQAA